jgi:hypothetical protein
MLVGSINSNQFFSKKEVAMVKWNILINIACVAEVEWCPVEVRKSIGHPEYFTSLIYCFCFWPVY